MKHADDNVSRTPPHSNVSKKMKHANESEDPIEYWKLKVGPAMKDAAGDKNVMENVAMNFFAEMWKQSGKKVAISTLAKITAKAQTEDYKAATTSVAGSWELSKNLGELFIDADLSGATFNATLNDEPVELELISTKDAHPLIYKGTTHTWDYCSQIEFDVKVIVSFNSSNPNRLEVNIEISIATDTDSEPTIGDNFEVIGTRILYDEFWYTPSYTSR